MCKLAAVTSAARYYKGPTCLADQAAWESTGHLYLKARGGVPPTGEANPFYYLLNTQHQRIFQAGSLQNKEIRAVRDQRLYECKVMDFIAYVVFNASQCLVFIPARFTR